MVAIFVQLEARLDKITPATSCLCGLSLRACVMVGAVFMTLSGCVMLVHSPMSMVGTVHSLFSSQHAQMQEWAFVYVHLYLICLHLLTTGFLLYAVPLSLLALRSAYQYEATYLRSYFRMNVQVVFLLVLGSLFNLMLDNTLCEMQRNDPYGGGFITGSNAAASLDADEDKCSFGANVMKLVLSIAVAIVYVYLAWITYCFRRELEQEREYGEVEIPVRSRIGDMQGR
ncbi:hypothetical protein T492DRAFT_1002023 [Pavlovales sp. CCMP2436]|nr:hypothetical protein T492DRAFT_1002023 [Pavlovales sp. CCMP2436]